MLEATWLMNELGITLVLKRCTVVQKFPTNFQESQIQNTRQLSMYSEYGKMGMHISGLVDAKQGDEEDVYRSTVMFLHLSY